MDQTKVKSWTRKILFAIFLIMFLNSYIHIKQEFKANEQVFSFRPVDVDEIMNKDLTVNLTEASYGISPYNLYVQGPGLEADRCQYFYALIQRWYTKYVYPIFIIIALMLIAKAVTQVDFVDLWKRFRRGGL